jgi:hypothetical protein
MVMQAIGSAFKKMSQRAMWRGDRGQSQMIESHGVAGIRSNLLNDTPTYKKEAIGLNSNGGRVGFGFLKKATSRANDTSASKQNLNNSDRNTNVNTKLNPSAGSNLQNQNASKNLGSSILDSLQ